MKEYALVSLEAEVESLNSRVKSLSKDLADRVNLQSAEEDHFQLVKRVTEEKNILEEYLHS